MKKAILITLCFLLIGCANPFSRFYNDQTGGHDLTPFAIIPNGEPKLVRGNDVDKDNLRMMEDGYALIGYSSFNAGKVDEKEALVQAKKVNAATVIVYSKYINTASGHTPLILPDTQTTYHPGSIYCSGGSASYFGSSTTYGSKTTYLPYRVDRYDYYATYWIKEWYTKKTHETFRYQSKPQKRFVPGKQFLMIADGYRAKGQYGQAILDYTKAIKTNPELVEAYYGRADAYYHMIEYGKAWQDVHKAESLRKQVDAEFLKNRREASGRESQAPTTVPYDEMLANWRKFPTTAYEQQFKD